MTYVPVELTHEPGTCHRSAPAVPPLLDCCFAADPRCCLTSNAAATMTGIAAASFFSNACRFGGCGLHFESLSELIAHIEDIHIGKPPLPLTPGTSAAASK